MFSWTMELLSNINKIAFFSWLLKMCPLIICCSSLSLRSSEICLVFWTNVRRQCSSLIVFLQQSRCHFLCVFPRTISSMLEVASGPEGELPGTGVVVVLWLSDVGVCVHREVVFLQVWRGLVVILGNSGALLLPGHFLIDRNSRLWSLKMPPPHLQHITLSLKTVFWLIARLNFCSVWTITKLQHPMLSFVWALVWLYLEALIFFKNVSSRGHCFITQPGKMENKPMDVYEVLKTVKNCLLSWFLLSHEVLQSWQRIFTIYGTERFWPFYCKNDWIIQIIALYM